MIYQEKRLYFYIQDDKLIIKLFGLKDDGKLNTEPERETAADKIEIIHNRKAVNAKKLKLGHPYFELPAEVTQKFEKVLQEKELRTLALVPAGISQLNGKEYYRLSVDIPAGMWKRVSNLFIDFGELGNMTGWLSCEPDKVREILKIS